MAQSRVAAQHQVVDAAILETFHGQALQRAQVVGHLGLAPASVRCQVGKDGAITFEPTESSRRVRGT